LRSGVSGVVTRGTKAGSIQCPNLEIGISMDNLRVILFFALALVLLMLYQAWQQDYGARPNVPEVARSSGEDTAKEGPAVAVEGDAGIPQVNMDHQGERALPIEAVAPQVGGVVTVVTDVLEVSISLLGGDVRKAVLLDFPVSLQTPDISFELLRPDRPNLQIAQSGLIGATSDALPSHEAMYAAEKQEYILDADKDLIEVPFTWTSPSGLEVTKRFVFRRSSYLVEVQHEVVNHGGSEIPVREYTQIQRTPAAEEGSNSFVYTYTGAAIYSPDEKYEKISFDDMRAAKLSRDVSGGWVAMLQHYFLSAWVPPGEQLQRFYSNVLSGERFVIGTYSPAVTIGDGGTHIFSSRLYIGPKNQYALEKIAPGLDLTVDYGVLTVISQPLFWLLDKLHSVLGNWGWAIVVLTVLIKLAFYKLSETSYRSMANMKRMTPRLQALKDRYGDDKQRLNQAMMELYKKEKINPLGGCLPIVIQIPVFIALYWVLLESVELRQAPFVLWIQDLSTADPYFVLPVIMGISMFVQQKLNPAPVDPIQAKIMMSLPIVFTVFFAFFASGLVLYWVVNNVLSIAQQWYITRKLEEQKGN